MQTIKIEKLDIAQDKCINAFIIDPSQQTYEIGPRELSVQTIQNTLRCTAAAVFRFYLDEVPFKVICDKYGTSSSEDPYPSIVSDDIAPMVVGPVIIVDDEMDGLDEDECELLKDNIRIVNICSGDKNVSEKMTYCLVGDIRIP